MNDGTVKCPGCGLQNYFSGSERMAADAMPLHCWNCNSFLDHHELEIAPVVFNRHQHLAGRRVEMNANGILYRGVFVEMTDTDVKLRGETGWIIIPVDKVSRITLEGDKPSHPNPVKMVDASFYEPVTGLEDEES